MQFSPLKMFLLQESEVETLYVMLVLQESLQLRFDRAPLPAAWNHPALGKRRQVWLVVVWAAWQGRGRDLSGRIITHARTDQFLRLATKQLPWVSVITLKGEGRRLSPADVCGFKMISLSSVFLWCFPYSPNPGHCWERYPGSIPQQGYDGACSLPGKLPSLPIPSLPGQNGMSL